MANCVCYNCKRPMDCTGEDLCDICEIDRDTIQTGRLLSDCCDAPTFYGLDVDIYDTARCSWCERMAHFYREV
jgi:hypothetical protein